MYHKKRHLLLLVLFVFLAGCIPVQPAIQTILVTPTFIPPSSTPDPCSKENLPAEVKTISRTMAEFDELSFLAQSTPKEQLAVVILEMHKVRNTAVDMDVPTCLDEVKGVEVSFMDGVILTMSNFMAGASGIPIQSQINATRELRNKYESMVAEKLGVAYVTSTPLPPTPVVPTSTPGKITVSTTQDMYVLGGPSLDYTAVGTIQVGETANAIGRSEIGEWIQIELVAKPGETGWLPKPMIKLNGKYIDLPIVPAPEKP
jgi:uncharacterized protein YraI